MRVDVIVALNEDLGIGRYLICGVVNKKHHNDRTEGTEVLNSV